MKKRRVTFRPHAEADLSRLYHYIASRSGTYVANRFAERIERACLDLETFPERGRRRDDIRLGLRVMTTVRRVVIAFQIQDTEVVIVRIYYGGRAYERLLKVGDD